MAPIPDTGTGSNPTQAVREAALARDRPHLLEHELAQRWRISVRTLQRWRKAGCGPTFLRLGRRVAYRLSDVESFEAAHVRDGGL